MWPMAQAMGTGHKRTNRAPAGATEIIDPCKRLCRRHGPERCHIHGCFRAGGSRTAPTIRSEIGDAGLPFPPVGFLEEKPDVILPSFTSMHVFSSILGLNVSAYSVEAGVRVESRSGERCQVSGSGAWGKPPGVVSGTLNCHSPLSTFPCLLYMRRLCR
jgi:hypothetical protein